MVTSRMARRSFWQAFAVLALVAAVGTSSAPAAADDEQIRAFKPVADAYVAVMRPRQNFGRTPVLRVDGAPEKTAYLRFDLRRLKGEITSVTLLLYSTTAARGGYAVRAVYEDDWLERRLTYENAPRPSSRYALSRRVRPGVWNAIDVTPIVDYDSGRVSIAITTRGARELSFGSRESRRGPRLVVRFEKDNR
jgi:hypothetical protein